MKKSTNTNGFIVRHLPSITIILLIVIWETLTRLLNVPIYKLPGPSSIIKVFETNWRLILSHTYVTVFESMVGLLISIVVGLVFAFFMSRWKTVRRILYPLMVVSQTVPVIALAPLILMWFGFGVLPKILIVVLVCFFPIAMNVTEGLVSADKDMIDLMKVMGASQYKIFKEIDPNNVISSKLPFSIPKDTLCIVHGTRYFKYHTINYYVKTKTADIEEIAIAILGNEKESFDRYIESNALVFKNINNTYRLYNDGLLEYKYVPGVEDQEKGDIGEAFEKAYFFINRVKNSFIDADDSLYLKNIKDDNPNYYEFIFDYKADELPVYINFDAKGKDKEPLKNALTIKVDSKRIIECRWYIINIEENRTQREYNVYFQDMLDDLSKKYGRQKLGDFNIKNVTRAYLINDNAFNTFSPVWIIENPNEEYYYVELKEKME